MAEAPGTNTAKPPVARAGVTYAELAKALGPGKEGWTLVQGSLVPEKPDKIPNPSLNTAEVARHPTIDQPTGRWQVEFATPEGVNRIVFLTPATPTTVDPGAPDQDPTSREFTWNIVSAPADVPERASKDETNARVAQAQEQAKTAKSNADIAAANLEKVQSDNREMANNAANGNGFITNEDLRKINKDAVDQKLSADQVALRKQEIENSNRTSVRSNEIAALNAATAQQNAATQAQAELSRTKYTEGQLDLDTAKFDWQRSQDEITNRNADAKIKLDQLTQQQANELAQDTLTQRKAEGLETSKNNAAVLAQNAATAQQTADTAAATAATNAASATYGNELQAKGAAGTVGGNLLSNRATAANNLLNNILSGVSNMAQGSAGRYGMLGGGIHAMPAGFDATQMLQGIQGYTGGMFGGQDTLDAAAAMVRNAAPGSEMTPMGQSAVAVMNQAFQRYQQMAGQPHPLVAQQQAGQQMAANGGMAAPVTQPQTVSTQPVAVAPAVIAAPAPPMVSSGTQGVGNPWANGATPPPGTVYQFQAPVTVPM